MPEKKKTRYRETSQSDPQGFAQIVRTFVRVVESDDPIKNAVETTDEPHAWRLATAEDLKNMEAK